MISTQALDDMLIEARYTIRASQRTGKLRVSLQKENLAVQEYSLRDGQGAVSFGGRSLVDADFRVLCRGLDSFLEKEEGTGPLSQAAYSSQTLIDKLMRGAKIANSYPASYRFLGRHISLPDIQKLPSMSDDELIDLKKRIASYEQTVPPGPMLVISNISDLHPFSICEQGIISWVFNPKMTFYETHSEEAFEFRDCLRKYAQ